MKLPATYFPIAVCVVIILFVPSFAQTSERRQASATPPEQLPNLPANANSLDTVASEIGLLRKSLQTLNTRLRELGEKAYAPDSSQRDAANDKQQNGIAAKIEVLTRVEQRAEVLRKQLIELTEKETSLKSRLVQLDEDMRPESIERVVSQVGSTRTLELRDVRRRVLENERRGIEALLSQTSQSRLRLDDDVKQADAMVLKLRQRLLPLIDKEIEKINPNQ